MLPTAAIESPSGGRRRRARARTAIGARRSPRRGGGRARARAGSPSGASGSSAEGGSGSTRSSAAATCSEQRDRVVVALVDRDPGERPYVAAGPLGEERRLAVPGGRDHEHEREGARRAEAVDQRRPARPCRPGGVGTRTFESTTSNGSEGGAGGPTSTAFAPALRSPGCAARPGASAQLNSIIDGLGERDAAAFWDGLLEDVGTLSYASIRLIPPGRLCRGFADSRGTEHRANHHDLYVGLHRPVLPVKRPVAILVRGNDQQPTPSHAERRRCFGPTAARRCAVGAAASQGVVTTLAGEAYRYDTRPLPGRRDREHSLGGSGLAVIRVVLGDDSFLAREGSRARSRRSTMSTSSRPAPTSTSCARRSRARARRRADGHPDAPDPHGRGHPLRGRTADTRNPRSASSSSASTPSPPTR